MSLDRAPKDGVHLPSLTSGSGQPSSENNASSRGGTGGTGGGGTAPPKEGGESSERKRQSRRRGRAEGGRGERRVARRSRGERSNAPAKYRRKKPMSPSEVIRRFAHFLTPYEMSEILEYRQVYCIGEGAKEKIRGVPKTPSNNGFDDKNGEYRIVPHSHVEYRYEILGLMGRGSFGQVTKVFDHKRGSFLALKIIRNRKGFHQQALIEVKILEHLMRKDREYRTCIVRVYGYFYFRNHLCITFEPLSYNLYEVLKGNAFRGLSLRMISRITKQLLVALKLLYDEKILHCDLKPENILLKSPDKASVRLIDFGSSCFLNQRMYTYLQSRFYRAPEVILGLPYDMAIDMWSLGCILGELYTGRPMFAGSNEHDQLTIVMQVLNVPPARLIEASPRRTTFFNKMLKPKDSRDKNGRMRLPGSRSLADALGCKDDDFLSFVSGCLQWEASERFTPAQALEHPFITNKGKGSEAKRSGAVVETESKAATMDSKTAVVRLESKNEHTKIVTSPRGGGHVVVPEAAGDDDLFGYGDEEPAVAKKRHSTVDDGERNAEL